MQPLEVVQRPILDTSATYHLPKKIPQLDRLRGLAILLVLVDHATHMVPESLRKFTWNGWMGVDLFFVLSGFLITGILWDTRDKERYFRRFYARRILRIWPAFTLLLFFAFCVLPLLKWTVGGPFLEIPKETLGLWAYLLMIQNLFANSLMIAPFLGVTWSLAVEEQFYLLWPVMLRYASRKMIFAFLFAALMLEPILRIWAMHVGIGQKFIYTNPLTHGDGLLCGAVIALWLRTARPKRRTLLLAGTALLAVGSVCFLLHAPPNDVPDMYCSPFLFTEVVLFASGLLLVALVSENTGQTLHRWFFMNKPLAFLGFISYSLYLYHLFFVRAAIRPSIVARLDRWHHTLFTQCVLEICAVAFSILLAWISRITMERAALSKKEIFD